MTAILGRIPTCDDQDDPPARPLHALALHELERDAVTALPSTSNDIVGHVQERATALAGGDPAVRRRSLARAAAVQEAQMQQLAALLATAITRSNPLVPTLDRLLTSATKRYCALMVELRADAATARRVMITARGEVTLAAEERR